MFFSKLNLNHVFITCAMRILFFSSLLLENATTKAFRSVFNVRLIFTHFCAAGPSAEKNYKNLVDFKFHNCLWTPQAHNLPTLEHLINSKTVGAKTAY